jgi:hypothetical protein
MAGPLDWVLSLVGAGETDPNAAITSRTMNATRLTSLLSVVSAAAATVWEPFGQELTPTQKLLTWGVAFLFIAAVVITDMWARAHTTAASIQAEVVLVTSQLTAKVAEEDVKVAAFKQTGGLLEFLVVKDLAGGQVAAEWRPSADVQIVGA